MTTIQPQGFLCYNNSDLIRDGYIYPFLTAEHDMQYESTAGKRLWERRIERGTTRKGIYYQGVYDDDNNLVKVRERRTLLPAEKIKVEIIFSKVMRNAIVHPISPGAIPGFAGFFLGHIGTGMGMGGITSGTTEMVFHLLDSETIINRPVRITSDIKKSGLIDCVEVFGGCPLSVFGVVWNYSKPEDEDEEVVNGFDFTSEQLDNIGRHTRGSYKGGPRLLIDGATDQDGRFGSVGIPEVDYKEVLKEYQKDIFIKIKRDLRRIPFRADNEEASGDIAYPFSSRRVNDAIDKYIEIDTNGLEIDDVIYVTISIAKKKHNRHAIRHRGDVGQGNTIAGLPGWNMAIGSRVDAFDYTLKKWPVFANKDLEESKLGINDYKNFKDDDQNDNFDIIEGWRLSDVNNERLERYWAADYRGILLVDRHSIEVIFPRESIRNQLWFRKYLEDLDFTYPSGKDGEYYWEDLEVKIEDRLDVDRAAGFLFDISETCNSLLYDREKIPYYRPFALAIQNSEKYSNNNDKSGIGIVHLDLKKNTLNVTNLNQYDLSYAEFNPCEGRPRIGDSCEDEWHSKLNYFSAISDPGAMGGRTFFSREYIENEFLGWRPEGGTIESNWYLETPYFCGNFGRDARVYIEHMGGPSLNNFSSIFVDTVPSIPSTMSMDVSRYDNESLLCYKDEKFDSLSLQRFPDHIFENHFKNTEIDFNRPSFILDETFDHEKYKIVGQNNILGLYPNYSNGIPLTIPKVLMCYEPFIYNFHKYKELMDYEYKLDDDKLTIGAQSDDLRENYIREIKIEYSLGKEIIEDEYISLYFEGSDKSITNIKQYMAPYEDDDEKNLILTIPCHYYNGNYIVFKGEFFNKADIKSIKALVVNPEKSYRFNQYSLDSEQVSLTYDRMGRIVIFFADDNANISAVVSYNNGRDWFTQWGLIRLLSGETASLPYALSSDKGSIIHLFYCLNDKFLMYKEIDVNYFNLTDPPIEYHAPVEFDITTPEEDMDIKESSLYQFSEQGRQLRRKPSYFLIGDSNDSYFEEQIKISQEIKNKNKKDDDFLMYPRFLFEGDIEEMKDDYMGSAYTPHTDKSGYRYLFYEENGLLQIKASINIKNWYTLAEDLILHKHFLIDDEKGDIRKIKNIQLIRDWVNKDILSILYFCDNMLFVRHFYSNLISRYGDQIYEYMELNEQSASRPIFLIGEMDDSIKEQARKDKIEDIRLKDSDMYIDIPYDIDMLELFDNSLSVDINTQPYAYVTKTGIARISYKDGNGKLCFINLNGLNNPIPEQLLSPI